MNKFNWRHLMAFILVYLIGFTIPFFTKTKDENLNSILTTSFTIVSTTAAIITLIVALILFDKFGFNAKFKEKQLDTVLELIKELRVIKLTISNGDFTYINYVRKCINLEHLLKNIYEVDKVKTLLFPNNLDQLLEPLYNLIGNPWLPDEIKEKTKFLNILAIGDVDDFDFSKYVKLNINEMGVDPWVVTAPKFTFEMFTINLSILLTTTIDWIKEHSNVNVDFELLENKQ